MWAAASICARSVMSKASGVTRPSVCGQGLARAGIDPPGAASQRFLD